MEDSKLQTDIAIIGGGISGLSLAYELMLAGRDFQLFEARGRFGGRILSYPVRETAVDLGPSWFWPGQPRMANLIERLGLSRTDQYAQGASVFEGENGDILKQVGFASMGGAWRVDGGMQAIVDALVQRLPQDRLRSNSTVTEVTKQYGVTFDNGARCKARQVVLAIPPRMIRNIMLTPGLSAEQTAVLDGIPTWMAGHAKIVAMYDHPFWRTAGLSGDVVSRRGPLVEIHDASGVNGTPAAVFGFVGLPVSSRFEREAELKAAAIEQLARLFGPLASRPKGVVLQDWAHEPFTATTADHIIPNRHPEYGLPHVLANLWDGSLLMNVTETASDFGGLLEGALTATDQTFARLASGESPE